MLVSPQAGINEGGWLGGQDSNLDRRLQRPLSYQLDDPRTSLISYRKRSSKKSRAPPPGLRHERGATLASVPSALHCRCMSTNGTVPSRPCVPLPGGPRRMIHPPLYVAGPPPPPAPRVQVCPATAEPGATCSRQPGRGRPPWGYRRNGPTVSLGCLVAAGQVGAQAPQTEFFAPKLEAAAEAYRKESQPTAPPSMTRETSSRGAGAGRCIDSGCGR
jgi:hypothetical protein